MHLVDLLGYVSWIDVIWILTPQGELKQRELLHTCHMQKFEKFYASLLIAWVSWLHIFLYNIFFNKYEPCFDCKCWMQICVQKAKSNSETKINNDLKIQSLPSFICRTRLLSYGYFTRKNQIRVQSRSCLVLPIKLDIVAL